MSGGEQASGGNPWAAGAIAGASVLGGLATSGLQVHEMRKNRRFARDMSSTEIQRRVADMREAGINPLMAVTGSGGGLGGAHAAPPGNLSVESPTARLDPQMFMQQAIGAAQVQKTHAETGKILSEKTGADMANEFFGRSMEDRLREQLIKVQQAAEQRDLTRAERLHLAEQEREIRMRIQSLDLGIKHSALDLSRAGVEQQWWATMGQSAKWMDELMPALRSVLPGLIGRRGARAAGKGGGRKIPKGAEKGTYIDGQGQVRPSRELFQ